MKRKTTSRVLAGAVALLLGCSSGTLTVNVDLLSFLDEDESRLDYGEEPIIPGYSPDVTVRTPIQVIPIAEEINDTGDMDRIYIHAGIGIDNRTGEATGDFRLFICGGDLDPFLSDAVLEETIVLVPDTSYTLDIVIEGDERLLQLFDREEIAVASELHLYPGGTLEENIVGSLVIEELTAVVSYTSTL